MNTSSVYTSLFIAQSIEYITYIHTPSSRFIKQIKHSLIFTFEHRITANWINTCYTFKDLIELLLVPYDDMNGICSCCRWAMMVMSNDDGSIVET